MERAKAEMLSLFQIKSNLKTLVSSVWKPEFERSGKHFVYVGEYTKFLIVLAKETKDVETLNSLARKIRRANPLLLDLKEIWELLYDSYLSVLGELVGPEPALAVAEVIPRMEFREKAAIYEAKMFEQEPKPAGLIVLQRLCELKKLNDKMAPEGLMGHYLAVCYSKLFIEVGGAELYPKELIRSLANPTEPSTDMAMAIDEEPADASSQPGEAAKNPEDEGEDDDHKDIRLKMAKLTTEMPSAVTNGSTAASSEEASSTGRDTSSTANGQDTETPLTNDTDASTTPATDATAKEGDATPSGDGVADLEDWKSRKKISAAELASRATTMCKAPPPSLKAPQSLQNRPAGPPLEEPLTSGATSEPQADVTMAPSEDTPVEKEPESTEDAPPEETAVERDEEETTARKDASVEQSPEGEEAKQLSPPAKRTSSRRNSRVEESAAS